MVKIYLYLLCFNKTIIDLDPIIGTYDCKVDAKGRLMIPVSLKKQLSDSMKEGFVLKRSVFQKCLELYPMSEWNAEVQKINKLNRYVKKNNDFIRLFMAGVRMIEIDDAGRLLVPKDLALLANISKDVVLSSAVSYIEVWDKTLYEQSISASAEDFSSLAEEVMGGIDIE